MARHRSGGFSWRYLDGIPVTVPEQTILDCATTVRNDKAYRRIVRQAQVDGLATHARLLAFAAMNAGRRGVVRLKRELEAGPSPTRSGFEDDVLEVFRGGGERSTSPSRSMARRTTTRPPARTTPAKELRVRRRGVRLLRVS